jgi:hypothetical protein
VINTPGFSKTACIFWPVRGYPDNILLPAVVLFLQVSSSLFKSSCHPTAVPDYQSDAVMSLYPDTGYSIHVETFLPFEVFQISLKFRATVLLVPSPLRC